MLKAGWCCALAGEVKEFGFRPVPGGQLPDSNAPPPLQPVPVLAPGMVADPRLALSIGVAGSIATEQVYAVCFRLSVVLHSQYHILIDLGGSYPALAEPFALLFPFAAIPIPSCSNLSKMEW
jgi:hypothetical protein